MPDLHKITIALTGEQIAALKAAVAAGEYATMSEIVSEALRDWQHGRELRRLDIDRLRELWDQGKASGAPAPLDFEEMKSEARRRLAVARTSAEDGC